MLFKVGERRRLVATGIDAHQQIVLDGHAAENAAAFRHQRDAGAQIAFGAVGFERFALVR